MRAKASFGCLVVILNWRESYPSLKGGEAHIVTRAQQLGIVLHHALDPCWGLELGSLSIGVLGVDKLTHDPAGRLEHFDVRFELHNQLVNASWIF